MTFFKKYKSHANKICLTAGLIFTSFGPLSADSPSPHELKSLMTASKGSPEFNLYSGREAYINYDFDKAAELFNAYEASKKKSSRDSALLPLFQSQLEVARGALENVQILKLVSRSIADENDFISDITLPSSAGILLPPDSIPFAQGRDEATIAFATEGRDYMIWSQRSEGLDLPEEFEVSPDDYLLVESERLTDGSWSSPAPLAGLGGSAVNADYPFMRADGTTLYFSAPAYGSMGGYDLFVASRDPQTGEFLTPRNLGMPFNSPFDDLMVAVDEVNGLGWLVTSRDMEEGKVAIYLYIFEESRKNYDSDSEEIIAHARLVAPDDFLPEEDELRTASLNSLRNSLNVRNSDKTDFIISMPDGKVYTRIENFSSPQARNLAAKYAKLSDKSEKDNLRLDELRRQYSEAKRSGNTVLHGKLANEIRELEEQSLPQASELKHLRNAIIQAVSK